MEQLKFILYESALVNPAGSRPLTVEEDIIIRRLLLATSQRPIRLVELIDHLYIQTGKHWSERQMKDAIRTLRREHAMPILSRRRPPAGLWWCSSADEMREFIATFQAQAIDELQTLRRIVHHNYPTLAGQLDLETWRAE